MTTPSTLPTAASVCASRSPPQAVDPSSGHPDPRPKGAQIVCGGDPTRSPTPKESPVHQTSRRPNSNPAASGEQHNCSTASGTPSARTRHQLQTKTSHQEARKTDREDLVMLKALSHQWAISHIITELDTRIYSWNFKAFCQSHLSLRTLRP